MENLLLGITTIVISSVIYLFAVLQFRRKNYRTTLTLIILAGLLLRIYVASDQYLHGWDERYHALVAKNMIQEPLKPTLYSDPIMPYDYKNWTKNHIWLHKQPLPLWIMAMNMWLFGANEFVIRTPSILFSTLGILLIFIISTALYNKKVAFLAAFLFSVQGLVIELAGGRVATDHIDICFLFLIELAVFFVIKFIQKKNAIYNILCGISIGLAILSKWMPALIVLPVWFLLVVDSKKFSKKEILQNILILFLVLSLIFVPWQVYIHSVFPIEAGWESALNFRHLTEVIEGRGGPFYFHFDNIRIIYGDLLYLPLIWFIWKTFKKPGNLKRMALSIWFLVPLLFFSFASTKMQGYTLFTAPALLIITSVFWFYIYTYRKIFTLKWLPTVILILLILFPIRYSIERIKPFHKRNLQPQWTQDLKNFTKNYSNKKEVVIFNLDHEIEAMFYTGYTVYDFIPKQIDIDRLIKNGYHIIVNDDHSSEKIKQLQFVELIEISKHRE